MIREKLKQKRKYGVLFDEFENVKITTIATIHRAVGSDSGQVSL